MQTEENWDFVTLYDGKDDASKKIATLSGSQGKFVKSSSGNALFVKFTSDESYFDGGGFHSKIQYYGKEHTHKNIFHYTVGPCLVQIYLVRPINSDFK